MYYWHNPPGCVSVAFTQNSVKIKLCDLFLLRVVGLLVFIMILNIIVCCISPINARLLVVLLQVLEQLSGKLKLCFFRLSTQDLKIC